ncbi:MAG: hypothetical protein IPK83_10355 [Planctomycetes bacterium]|nr:hypothetical protein [Planctomycetota bacterium]
MHLIQPGSNVYFYRPGSEKTRALQVISTKPSPKPETICITVSDPPIVPCPTCQTSRPCTKHEPHPLRPRFCVTCSHSHIQVPIEVGWGAEAEIPKGGSVKVSKVKDLGNGKHELTLNTNKDFTKDCSVTLNRIVSSSKETELFNIALVRRGAPITARPGLKEALIYKEFASQLDFSYTNNTQRVVRIHKKERKMVLTEGSTDPRGRNPNIVGQTRTWTHYKTGQAKQYEISEINKSGIGGGGVITIEGITFGIEVCLDHGTHRLAKFYGGAAVECSDSTCGARVDLGDNCPACGQANSDTFDPLYLEDGVITCSACGDFSKAGDTCGFCNAATLQSAVMAKPGDPRVQIHLIPSWGMDIGLGAGCCVDDGLAFNVDGDRAAKGTASVVRKFDGTWGCDRHLDVAEAVYGHCTEGTGQWYCPELLRGDRQRQFWPGQFRLQPSSTLVRQPCGSHVWRITCSNGHIHRS